MIEMKDLRKRKHLPKYKLITKQWRIKVDEVQYEVIQSLRSYGIGMRQRGFIKIGEQLYELPEDWTSEVY